MCAHGCKWTSNSRLNHAYYVKRPKWEDTLALLLDPFHHLMNSLPMCMWTSQDPLCEGESYLLTCADRFSYWCEVLPMLDITTYTTAKTFVSGRVSCFGVPAVITIDRRKQFKSDLFNQLVKLLGSKKIKTTEYHLEANGLVE